MTRLFVAFVVALTWLCLLPLCARVDDERAAVVLHRQGYSDPVVGRYVFFECGVDVFSASFTARAPDGEPVAGVICCGLSSCSLRWSEPNQ
jgi:hypothetical protein